MKGSYKKTTRRTHALARSPAIVRTTQKYAAVARYAAAAEPEVTLYTPEPEEAKAKSVQSLEAQAVGNNKRGQEHGDRRDAPSTSTQTASFQEDHKKAKEDLDSCTQKLQSQDEILNEMASKISEIQKEKSGAQEQAREVRAALEETKVTLDSLRAELRGQAAASEADKQLAREEIERANEKARIAQEAQRAADETRRICEENYESLMNTLKVHSSHSAMSSREYWTSQLIYTHFARQFADVICISPDDPKSMSQYETSFLLSYAEIEGGAQQVHAYCGACRIHDLCELMTCTGNFALSLSGNFALSLSDSARKILEAKRTETLTSAQMSFLNDVMRFQKMPHPSVKSLQSTDAAYGHVEVWDVRDITEASQVLVNEVTSTTLNLAFWDTRKMTSMSTMFKNCTLNICGLESWNTARVRSMASMFENATQFDCDIGKWDTGSLLDASRMFLNAQSFRGVGLDEWNVSSVTNMQCMFQSAVNFDANLSDWNVSNVSNMDHMFKGAVKFASDLRSWHQRASMIGMFDGVPAFNDDENTEPT